VQRNVDCIRRLHSSALGSQHSYVVNVSCNSVKTTFYWCYTTFERHRKMLTV